MFAVAALSKALLAHACILLTPQAWRGRKIRKIYLRRRTVLLHGAITAASGALAAAAGARRAWWLRRPRGGWRPFQLWMLASWASKSEGFERGRRHGGGAMAATAWQEVTTRQCRDSQRHTEQVPPRKRKPSTASPVRHFSSLPLQTQWLCSDVYNAPPLLCRPLQAEGPQGCSRAVRSSLAGLVRGVKSGAATGCACQGGEGISGVSMPSCIERRGRRPVQDQHDVYNPLGIPQR